MTDTAKLLAIKTWCAFMIKSQEELKKEWLGHTFPDWNKGYLECLEDLRSVLDDKTAENKQISTPKDRFIFNYPAECQHFCTWCKTSMVSNDLYEHIKNCVNP